MEQFKGTIRFNANALKGSFGEIHDSILDCASNDIKVNSTSIGGGIKELPIRIDIIVFSESWDEVFIKIGEFIKCVLNSPTICSINRLNVEVTE